MINARYVRYSSTTCLSRFKHNDHRASSTLKLNILWLHAFRVCKHIIDDRSRDMPKFILPRLQNQQSRSIRGIESEGVRLIKNIDKEKRRIMVLVMSNFAQKKGEVKHMAYNITNFSCHFPDFLHKMTCFFFFLNHFYFLETSFHCSSLYIPYIPPPPPKLGEGDSFKFSFLFLYLNKNKV